jgi:molybdopterin converting factor subunit 1
MGADMMVRVKLFAIAKERVGRDELEIDLKDRATISDLRAAIAIASPALQSILPHAMWAVDATYADDTTILREQSEVAMIPPVSGG